MSEQADATITEEDAIITVTFDRQRKLNAINTQMSAALWEAANALADRDDLRCMVITAKGPYFTAGIDIASGTGNRPGNPETEHLHPGWNFRRNYRSHHLLYDEFESIEKPIVLAAQGHCLGAGLEMAASCDFRFCTPLTEFGLPEVHIGVIAGSGGTSRLTRLVGPSWGKWLAMAGQAASRLTRSASSTMCFNQRRSSRRSTRSAATSSPFRRRYWESPNSPWTCIPTSKIVRCSATSTDCW